MTRLELRAAQHTTNTQRTGGAKGESAVQDVDIKGKQTANLKQHIGLLKSLN